MGVFTDATVAVKAHFRDVCEPTLKCEPVYHDDCLIGRYGCENEEHSHRQCDYCGKYINPLVSDCVHAQMITYICECGDYSRQYAGWKYN